MSSAVLAPGAGSQRIQNLVFIVVERPIIFYVL
jgi:hypothetical protein